MDQANTAARLRDDSDTHVGWFAYFDNAIDESDLPTYTRWLLICLARRADPRTGILPDGVPPAESLAAVTKMSVRSVYRHAKIAEASGWLIVERGQ